MASFASSNHYKKKKKHPEVTLNFMFSEISSLLEAGTRCNAEDHD
jgi:hypothetical protein